nr:MAG TPA: major capsid protein [Caudoviricetes sp.]
MNLKDMYQKNQKLSDLRQRLAASIKDNKPDELSDVFSEMCQTIGDINAEEYEAKLNGLRQELDSSALYARGVRQLTTEEKEYYQKISDAMRSENPKQALENVSVVFPQTIISRVMEDLTESHPLLSKIQFTPTGGAIRMMLNTDGRHKAAWGKLCAKIIEELTSGFKEVDVGLYKLSAFIPVCKAQLDLGPEWLDRYIRAILAEALANGLEDGIVMGDGNDKPIGMIRDVSESASVVGGAYPEKAKIKASDFEPTTMGKLVALLAVTPNGKDRTPDDLILLVNPQDYYEKVMPATTIRTPDGTYRNNVLPYPATIIPVSALPRGQAVFGVGRLYFAAVGMNKGGRLEYDDSYRFLEDERVYLIKLYANGFPVDNNAFLNLDISGLRPLNYKVETVTSPTPSADANLASLKLGNLTLTPAFSATTASYTATTDTASNVITATPANAGATVQVKVGSKIVENGKSATWAEGSNTVTINVTAEDGTTAKAYTVTVTKS